MTDSPKTDATARRSWITLGEAIALAALAVSAFGAWLAWKGSNDDRPTRIVEQRTAIPLTLRGQATDGGRSLEIAPIEPTHALQSLKITTGSLHIELGGDGELVAKQLERALSGSAEKEDRTLRIRLRIDASYVEAGADKHATGSYVLTYRWEGGGLLGGRSLRLVGLSRG